MKELQPFLTWWRTTVVRDREIVEAEVAPEHRGPSSALARVLASFVGTAYWVEEDGPGRIVVIRVIAPAKPERWWLHATLFVSTFITVWMGGALLAGSPVPILSPFQNWQGAGPMLSGLWAELMQSQPGLDFAMALMAILLAHETGHFIVARRYNINASPPYFLPAPPFVNFIGTFGAFIRLRSPIVDRRQLMDVGAAGPWAGFVVAVAALVVGLLRSEMLPGPSEQYVALAQLQIFLGDSPLMFVLRRWLVGDGAVALHPLAFAGWLGLFVTMLNLLPMGQLDGGHILYALFGRAQRWIGAFMWLGLIGLGFLPGQWWWWIWAVIILLLGRGQLRHPQVLDTARPLPRSRAPLGWATILLFVVTFTPAPIRYF